MPAAGYYQDSESLIYVTGSGRVYSVYGFDAVEPEWRECGPPLVDDAVPAELDERELGAAGAVPVGLRDSRVTIARLALIVFKTGRAVGMA